MSVDLLLWILALIAFGLAAFGVGAGRVHLGWLGAALAALTFII